MKAATTSSSAIEVRVPQGSTMCHVCASSVRIGEIVAICPECNAVAHIDCAEDNFGRCGRFGCSGKMIMRPREIDIVVSGTSAREVESVARSLLAEAQSKSVKGSYLSMTNILFLAANPKDTGRLRLDEEIRGIKIALRQADFGYRFLIHQHWAVRVANLVGLLLNSKPEIVHFSGHGSRLSEIVLEDDTGRSHPVSTRALSRLFSVLKDNIRCVVLNACYSEEQAQAIANHIDCVVGMSRAVTDPAAISFSTAFYQALGYGRDVKTAFELGCVQVDLENLDDQDVPKLLATRANPSKIVFAFE